MKEVTPKTELDLSIYGIQKPAEIFHNISYDDLFKHETDSKLEGYEKGFVTSLGSVAVDTGIFTGRSPKDKYIVRDTETNDKVWWAEPGRKGSDNKPIDQATWNHLKEISYQQLSGKKLYVMDAFVGANVNTRLSIRVITEVAWAAHFVKNMFIRPSDEELANFKPEFVMLHACKTVNSKWHEQNLNSDVYVAFNLLEKMAVVGGSWYGGEIKKGFFSVMNYFMPLQNIASMHCSANMGKDGSTSVFFGLSGTGKTTLSADPERYLIGDDEHGWDEEGIFNYEGGCYAKCIDLDKDKEPDIYNAIRKDALLENVVYDEKTGEVNFKSGIKTENTRVSYPIYHINNIVTPVSKGTHPKKIIFLTADAFGVLPPVSKLTNDQAMYYFLSGFTSKLAGTERGVKEPSPTFSPAFGAPFLLLHPTVYAQALAKKMKEHGATAYLVNTGWIGGPYGVGKRIDLPSTRKIITAILDGSIDDVDCVEMDAFGLMIPKEVKGVDSSILIPKNSWKYPAAYDEQAQKLADKFILNFENFSDSEEGKRLVAAGPRNKHMKQFYDYYQNKIEKLESEQRNEIIRLKDQIYILQNAFSEYISFNSINTNYKNRDLKRHIPVEMFVGSNDKNDWEIATNFLRNVMKVWGFDFYTPGKTPEKFNERIVVSKEKFSSTQLCKLIDNLQLALEQMNKEDVKLNDSFAEFIKKTSHINELVIKIGSILFVKYQNRDGESVIKSYKLSISNMIHIDKHLNLLQNPIQLVKELHNY